MNSGNKLQKKLLMISIIPIIVMGVFFAIVEMTIVKAANEEEIYSTLDGVCLQARQIFNHQFPNGNYTEEHGNFFVDGEDMSQYSYVLDNIKDFFGTEVSIFIGDKRAITTLVDDKGERIVGSFQTDRNIIDTVKGGGKYVSDNVTIYKKKYYGEYIPLYNDDDEVVGMVFAGMSNDNFVKMLVRYYFAIGAFTLIITVITILIVMQYSKRLAEDLEEIKVYFGMLADKQADKFIISEAVLERDDEIGELARYAKDAGTQLKMMIGRDPLTGLYNRRSGLQYLGDLWEKAVNGDMCTIVMCDMDYFKKVNDMCGHDMGDAVLVKATTLLKKYFNDEGYVIRWGGEEFVIGVPYSKKRTIDILEKLRTELRRNKFTYKNGEFYITMTFGVAEYNQQVNLQSLINEADDKLYRGKEEGRDRIVE